MHKAQFAHRSSKEVLVPQTRQAIFSGEGTIYGRATIIRSCVMETRNHDNIERAPATRISAPRDGPHPGHPPLPDTSIVHVKEPEPRERGMPPVIPSPNRRLKISTGPNMAREKKQSVTRGPSGPRRQSRIVMLTNGHAEPRKPMPKWKRGYVGFKREVCSCRWEVVLAHRMMTITQSTISSVKTLHISSLYKYTGIECAALKYWR